MRYIRLQDLEDLVKIAKGIEIISGGGRDATEHLFCYFNPKWRLPVVGDNSSDVIGYWQYVEEEENIVFIPANFKNKKG